MKFEIYNEKTTEKRIFFKLVEDCEEIRLTAVNEYGEHLSRGDILSITEEGKLCLYPGINETLGLKLDRDGKIDIED